VASNALSLDDCIKIAIETHPDMAIYESKTEQKDERLKAIIAKYRPQLNVIASYDRLSYTPPNKQRFLNGSDNDFQTTVNVTQPLFTSGKITAEKKSARHAIEASEQAYLATKENVIFDVKTAYYKLLFAKEILKSKKDLLKYSSLSYRTAVELNQRSKLPREETVLLLKVQLDEVKQEVLTADSYLKITKDSLLNAMGFDSVGNIEVIDIKDDVIAIKETSIDISSNPEVVRISKEVKEAESLIKATKSRRYPQLEARLSYGYEWPGIEKGKQNWTAGADLSFPIFDWGKIKAEVNEIKAYKNELESRRILVEQQLDLELASAQAKHDSARSKFIIARESLKNAHRSLNLFETRYKSALATSIELLVAQKEYSQAQFNYSSTLADMRIAKAEIEKIAAKGYDTK
jgi:outer membrane protein TolC